jgi:hypothetical protein
VTARRVLACGLLAAGLTVAAWSRTELRAARRALGIGAATSASGPAVDTALGPAKTAALVGSLGVLRAAAIDFLWLRAIGLERRGDFFEAVALARTIAALQPRIDAVWTFQARSLAYDIPPGMPERDRWPWVAAGIDLLRKEGLDFNPRSPSLHFELAFIFYHKIGGDHDPAAPFYRTELAREFEAERGAERWRDALRTARLDAERLERLEARLGCPLDLRVAGAHALYWCEQGLALPARERDRFVFSALKHLRAASLLALFHRGRPVRPAPGGHYAFLPDPRFETQARQALAERVGSKQSAAQESPEEELRALDAAAIRYLFLGGDAAAARQRFAEAMRRGTFPGARSFEEFLLADLEPTALDDPHAARLALARAQAGAVALDAAGEPGFAAGLRALADVIRARAADLWPGALDPQEALPEPDSLPFGVEALDTARRARARAAPGTAPPEAPR